MENLIKEQAINTIKQLPEGVSWDELMYELYVRQKIENGIKAANEGKVVSHDELRRKLFK